MTFPWGKAVIAVIAGLSIGMALGSYAHSEHIGTWSQQQIFNINCNSDRAAVLEDHVGLYQEQPVSRGITKGGVIVELLTSPSGSWTLAFLRPDGTYCAVFAGENWENLEVEPLPQREKPDQA